MTATGAGAFAAGGGHLLMQGDAAAATPCWCAPSSTAWTRAPSRPPRRPSRCVPTSRSSRTTWEHARELVRQRPQPHRRASTGELRHERRRVRGRCEGRCPRRRHHERVRPISHWSSASGPPSRQAFPYVAARVRLDLAHTYLALGEVAGARLMLSEVGDLLAVRPGIAPLRRGARDAARARGWDGHRASRCRLAHHGGAPLAGLPAQPPVVPRDRGSPVRVHQHRQVAGDLDLLQAGRVVPGRGHRGGGRHGSPRRVGDALPPCPLPELDPVLVGGAPGPGDHAASAPSDTLP